MRRIVFLLVLVPLLAPAALATPPSCASATTATSTPTGVYALKPSSQEVEVWLETNSVDGLQKVECVDAEGQLVAPDKYVGRFGIAPGGQPVCVPRVGCVWI